uniref:Ig-like domain-containing protein n=1 Tax=Oryzias latipes TaxID=8090 RepID=A0A3P9H2S5_ORYLA
TLPTLVLPLIHKNFLGQPDCDYGFCISVSDEEITADSGLCVVIPCSFSTPYYFNLQHLIWFKCESDKRCGDSDIIFHTNKNTNKPLKSEFLGRVSLLDPDLNHQNCSIIISDLRESDSGFYQLRVNGYYNGSCLPLLTKHVMFPAGSRQKPTVTLPDLMVGHQATLTCTAPALCSKSPPGITWMWRGAESLTAVTQRHHSTLTFIPTTEHHNSKITCRIQFSDDTTTEETVNLHVNCENFPLKIQNTDLKEGMTLNLTCTTSVTPAEIQWIRFGSKTDQLNRTSAGLPNNTAIYLQEERKDSGRYFCAANHQNWTETVHVDVTVMLEGSACVRRSDVLTCTCIGTGFPLPNIKWAQLSPPTEYWLTTNVSGHTVRSSLTLKATKQDNVSVRIVCSGIQSLFQTAEVKFITGTFEEQQAKFLFSLFSQIQDCLTVAEDSNCIPEGAENEAVSTGEAAPKLRSGSGDVEYASIDFSLLKRRERTQELQTAATEYAEVKVKKEGKHAAGEEEAMMEEDDKTLLCVSKKKDAEEEAVYSSVNDLMDEI